MTSLKELCFGPFSTKKALCWSLIFVGLKILIFMTSYFLLVKSQGKYALCYWDCGYYKEISEQGYTMYKNATSNLAFFPLFPLSVKIFRSFLPGLDFASTAILLNITLFGFLTFLLSLWTYELGFRNYYYLPALLLSADRYSLWSHVPYTESLFGVLLLLSLVISKKKWLGPFSEYSVAIVGGLASATRIVGLSIVAGLGLSRVKEYLKTPIKGAIIFVLGVSGVALFFYYLHLSQGMWNASLKTTGHWGRHFSLLGIFHSTWFFIKFFYFPTIILFIGSIWFLIQPPKGLSVSLQERITFAMLLLIPMASTVQTSLPRYITMVFIAYIAWAWIILKFKNKYALVVWALILITELYWQVVLSMKFFREQAFLWAG